jgi:hypothetical protein
MVYRHLSGHMAMRRLICKWMPHKSKDHLRRRGVTIWLESLDPMNGQRALDFWRLVTGDESWFCLQYSPDHMWSCAPNQVAERVDQGMGSEKVMLVVL